MEKKNIAEAVQYQEERFTKKIIFQKGDSVVFLDAAPHHLIGVQPIRLARHKYRI